tara:strand:+ start:94 stop:342 length:249 start_codon:yes stop_codon:yes gene_type:complete
MADAQCPPHWWIIQTIPGRTSPGICKLCGAEQSFPNFLDTATWHERYDPRSAGVQFNPEILKIEEQQRKAEEREEQDQDGNH